MTRKVSLRRPFLVGLIVFVLRMLVGLGYASRDRLHAQTMPQRALRRHGAHRPARQLRRRQRPHAARQGARHAPVGAAPHHPRPPRRSRTRQRGTGPARGCAPGSRRTTGRSRGPAAIPAASGCRPSPRRRKPASPRSSRRGGRRVRRATGAWRWTGTCCRSSAGCRWTGSARRRSTRCCAPMALAGKHATVKTDGRGDRGGAGLGADQRVPVGGFPCGDGAPEPAEAGGGTDAPRRPALLGGGRGAGEDRRHPLRALDEAGDPLHGADGGAADRGAPCDLGAVRHRRGRFG